jgi:hypothetical protein
MLRWSFFPVLVLLAAMTGCQPTASSPSSKASDKTDKQTTSESTGPASSRRTPTRELRCAHLIQTILPLVFCCVPIIAGVLIAVSIPRRRAFTSSASSRRRGRRAPHRLADPRPRRTLFVLQVL